MDKRKEIALQACLQHIRQSGWLSLNLYEVATKIGLTYQEIYSIFPDKSDVLAAFMHEMNEATLAHLKDLSEEDNYRDRLFAVTMARFEVAQPYKEVIRIFLHEALRDPHLILNGFSQGMNMVTWLLDVAGLQTNGWGNLVRIQIFAFAYLKIAQCWIIDETPDMSLTMATLDRNLHRLSQIPGFF